jgi:hypothetical protein
MKAPRRAEMVEMTAVPATAVGAVMAAVEGEAGAVVGEGAAEIDPIIRVWLRSMKDETDGMIQSRIDLRHTYHSVRRSLRLQLQYPCSQLWRCTPKKDADSYRAGIFDATTNSSV